MIVDISDKVVVITGSSKGIGRELAKAFAKENAKIVINYCHSKSVAEKLFEEVKAINSECLLIRADVTKPEEVSKMHRETIKAFGRVDILINNAGLCEDNSIQMMPLQQWQRVIDVNLTGIFLCSREFSKSMIMNKSGKIINIASLKGQEGSAGQVNYSASKAGVIGFTKALAKELGQYNIAVNAICPGFIVTDMNRHNEEKLYVAQQKSVLNLGLELQGLIGMVLFMSSDIVKCVSGQVFNIDSRIN